MGGGDLNLKKSWHPHTLKNQKRVYEAEQANAAERRKVQELQREIQNERNFEELKQIGQRSGVLAADEKNRLEWMYKGAENALNREEYLTGRAVDKHFEERDKMERQKDTSSLVGVTVPKNHVEHECIPFSIRAFRGAPSSEEQVDLQRKIMEDPLMMIQQKEMETRQKLLQNPVKLKEIHRLLQQDKKLNESSSLSSSHKKKKKSNKSKKSKKKRSQSDSENSDDLDSQLAKKYKKLLGAEKSESLSIDKLLNEKYAKLSSELDKIKNSKKKEKKGKNEKKKRDSSNSSSNSSSKGDRNRRNSNWNAHDAYRQRLAKGREQESSRNWSHAMDDRRNREMSPQRNRDQRRSRSPRKSDRSRDIGRDRFGDQRRKYSRSRSPPRYRNIPNERRQRSRSPRPQRQSPFGRYRSGNGGDASRNRSTYYNGRNRSRSRSRSPRRKPNRRHSRSKSRSRSHTKQRTNDSKSANDSRRTKGDTRKMTKSPEIFRLPHHESTEHRAPESSHTVISVAAKSLRSPKKSSSSSSSGTDSSSDSNSDSDTDRKTIAKNYGLITAGGEKIEIDKNDLAKCFSIPAPKKPATVAPSSLPPKKKLTDEEKEARLREMQQNAEWHDKELHINRKRNEERVRLNEEQEKSVEFDRNYIHKEMHKALTNQDSVEARLKSNKNNIQRMSSSMHSHFAKK